MKKKLSRLGLILLMVMMVTSLMPLTALAESTTINVSTAQELKDAVQTVNTGAAGEYVINITTDIDMNRGSITFNSPNKTVTIQSTGGAHTISNVAHVSLGTGPLTVNLGGNQESLTISGIKINDEPGIVVITNGYAVLNMYDGVTLKDHEGNNYLGGGVTLQGGTFNMYGGSIENCGIKGGSNCFGGGVAVLNGSLFNMYGGTIKNCYANTSLPSRNAGLIPWGAGGGVIVYNGSTFNMSGGTITGCSTTEAGGGVAVIASTSSYYANGGFGNLDSTFNMTGGSIEGNSAGIYGGGVYASGYYINAISIGPSPYKPGTPSNPGVTISAGSITDNTAKTGGGLFEIQLNASVANAISDGVLLCNNLASQDGSDMYISACILQGPSAAAMSSANYANEKPADATGRPISAWYEDYNEADGGVRYVNMTADERPDYLVEDVSTLDAGRSDLALIAAPGAVTYTLETSVDGGNGTISQGKECLEPGSVETVTFTPDNGYEIDNVTVNGEEVQVTDNALEVTMNGDMSVVVTFKKISDPAGDDDPEDNPDNPTDNPNNPVAPADKDKTPPTGDDSQAGLLIALLMASAAVLTALRKKNME